MIDSPLIIHGIFVVGYPDLNTVGIILLAICNLIGSYRRYKYAGHIRTTN